MQVICLLLLALVVGVVQSQWTCLAFVYEGDNYLRSFFNGQQMYDYQIGAGMGKERKLKIGILIIQ